MIIRSASEHKLGAQIMIGRPKTSPIKQRTLQLRKSGGGGGGDNQEAARKARRKRKDSPTMTIEQLKKTKKLANFSMNIKSTKMIILLLAAATLSLLAGCSLCDPLPQTETSGDGGDRLSSSSSAATAASLNNPHDSNILTAGSLARLESASASSSAELPLESNPPRSIELPTSVIKEAAAAAADDDEEDGQRHTMGTFMALVAPSGGAADEATAEALMSGGGGGVGQSAASSSLIRTVNPGDRVNIPCSLANAGGSIQFAKDDQPIILDSGCAQCQLDISNDGQASLTINRVSSKDQGHWQCWRLDSSGKVKQKIPIIQLVVTNSPELPILIVNDKELLLGGNNLDATITVKENEMVQFKCVIKGASSPVDYVHWMLDSSQNVTDQSQLMVEFSQQENNYLTQSLLRLNATKSMNLKSISCLSNHQLWLTPMTVTAFLNVLYEPSFTISREPGFGMPVSEGTTVILKCEIDSNPASSPIWIKDADNKTASANNNNNALTSQQQQQQQVTSSGKEASGEPIVLDTQEDGSLVFQPAQRGDSGWYRCKTENKYGNFSSFGYYLNIRPASLGSSSPAPPPASHQQPRYSSNSNNNHHLQQANTNQLMQAGGSRLMAPNQPAARVSMMNQQQQQQQQQPAPTSLQPSSNNIMNNDQPATSNQFQSPQSMFNPMAQTATDAGGSGNNIVARCPSRPDGFPAIDHPVSVVSAILGRPLVLPLRFCCQPGPARVFWIHRHLAMIPGRMFGPYITREIYPSMNSFYCYESTFEIESVKPEDIGTVHVFVSNEKGHAGAQIHIQLAKTAATAATTTLAGGFNGNGDGIGTSLGSRFHLAASSANTLRHSHLHWALIIASLLTAWYHINCSRRTITTTITTMASLINR